jgi:ADP-heptose:LPS heptosyltransferase
LRIGIIRTSSIGDVVLGTACLDYLRQVAPEAEIFWVGRKPSLKLIHQCWPGITPLEFPSRSDAKLFQKVLETLKTCDAVIDLQTSFRTRRLVAGLRRAKVPVFSADKAQWYRMKLVLGAWLRGRLGGLTGKDKVAPTLQYKMMLEAVHLALVFLKKADVSALDKARPQLPHSNIEPSDQSWLLEMSFGSWLAVSPGASHETKRAPSEVFADILSSLASLYSEGSSVPGLVFVGGAEDRIAAVTLLDQLPWPSPVINLAGKLTLEQTTIALAKATTLLSNDSGLAHIAEAVGTSVSVLFGPTTEAFGFSSQRLDSASFSSNVGCRPCSKHGKRCCRYGDKMCFLSIDTRQVARHLKEMLSIREVT